MTDAEVDELLNPPRRWPPLSVWGLVAVLVGPPLAGIGRALLSNYWSDGLIPLVALLIVLRPANSLLRGRPEGVGGVIGVLGVVGLMGGASAAVEVSQGGFSPYLLNYLPLVAWMAVVAVLAWWPETRRWSGLLPPRLVDGD